MAGSIVQGSYAANDAGGTTASQAAPAITGVTAGNTIIVFVGWSETGGTNPVCTGVNDGTAYASVAAKLTNSADGQNSQVWILENVSAGTHTVTASFSPNASFRRIRVIEVSGTQTASSVDQVAQVAQNTTTAISVGPTSATTNANDFVIGFTQNTTQNDPGTGTLTAGSGYTIDGSNLILGIEYKSVTSTGAQTATFTGSAADSRTSHVLALKESAASGPTTIRFEGSFGRPRTRYAM